MVSEENNEVVLTGAKNKISGTFEIEASDKKLAFVIDCEEKKEEDMSHFCGMLQYLDFDGMKKLNDEKLMAELQREINAMCGGALQ